MELRAKSEPKEFTEKDNSAHQFSVRDVSLQADSEERAEIAMQTSAIDLKSMNQQVDIYDLDNKRDQGTQGPMVPRFFKQMKDQGVTTDLNRKLLCTQDWFYSKLYRDMLRAYFKKQGKQLPDSIAKRFSNYDQKGNFKEFDDPLSRRQDMTTQTCENPQEEVMPELKVFSEPEVTYEISLFKQKMVKNKDVNKMQALHGRATHSIKVLTKQTVESQQPICNTLSKHESVNKENIKLLLYRLQQMYSIKSEA